jgi:putative ABC transport system permease protein
MKTGTLDLSLWDMAAIYAMVLVPIGLIVRLKLGIVRDAVVSLIRMTIQLALVGLYLKFIFELNSVWVNLLWILVMIVVANSTVLGKTGLLRRRFFLMTFIGIGVSTAVVVCTFVLGVIRPSPLYDARYLVPISGMVLGNCMRGNVLSLERFFAGIRDREKEFITYQMLGATLSEASRPYLRDALRAALAPTLSTMATMGIVSLPGMMTGQILGGSFPLTAIKYQIAIMICIFTGITVASVVNVLLCMPIAFDEYGMLRQDIWQD